MSYIQLVDFIVDKIHDILNLFSLLKNLQKAHFVIDIGGLTLSCKGLDWIFMKSLF